MVYRRWLWAAGVLFVLGAGAALAADNSMNPQDQSNQAYQSNSPATPSDQPAGRVTLTERVGNASLHRATNLIGAKVLNTKGENLGTVYDIVLTPDRKFVSYAALAHGGMLGMGTKYFAIPWSALQYSAANHSLLLDASKQDLDNAQGFDKNNWPDQPDTRWSRQAGVSGYVPPGEQPTTAPAEGVQAGAAVGTEQKTETSSTQTKTNTWFMGCPTFGTTSMSEIDSRRVSKIIGLDVRNNSNEELGKLNNLVIDSNRGVVAYGIVSYGGIVGMGGSYVAVPWSAVTVQPSERVARINTTKANLDAVAFTSDHYPDLASRTYAHDISEHFNAQPYYETYGFVGGAAAGADMYGAWRANSDYSRKFNPANVTTTSGTIESVSTFMPARGSAAGILLRVRTSEGRLLTVHAGPKFWAEQQNISFSNGDQVSVTGSAASINGRTVIVASEITKGDQTLKLRDSQGAPVWESGIPAQGPGNQ